MKVELRRQRDPDLQSHHVKNQILSNNFGRIDQALSRPTYLQIIILFWDAKCLFVYIKQTDKTQGINPKFLLTEVKSIIGYRWALLGKAQIFCVRFRSNKMSFNSFNRAYSWGSTFLKASLAAR